MGSIQKHRTPLIKPRTQGGTFYTFGSAMEDIGLNINESVNKIAMSHYVLLNIPKFTKDKLNDILPYSEFNNAGDMLFAEYFENGILDMEAVVRNNENYNYSYDKTVSERVFWKFILNTFKEGDDATEGYEDYFSSATTKNIVKCFGNISAGSQRSDEYGIYNETFVQIPSSYGSVDVKFRKFNDDNYKSGNSYVSSDSSNEYIEGLDPSSLDPSAQVIEGTGISPVAHYDNPSTCIYTIDSSNPYDNVEVVFDPSVYGEYETLDEVAIGTDPETPTGRDFTFNAILVYYSIYDIKTNETLATNAFGLYILDSAKEISSSEQAESETAGSFEFNKYSKKKGSSSTTGNSFSFRLNIKPASAYSGDVIVNDNSTAAFAESTDFTDVIRNLSSAVNVLKSNSRLLYKISSDNESVKNFAASTISKVDEISQEIATIKSGASLSFDTLYQSEQIQDSSTSEIISNTEARAIINCIKQLKKDNNVLGLYIDTSGLVGDNKELAESLLHTDSSGKECYDVGKLLTLLISSIQN